MHIFHVIACTEPQLKGAVTSQARERALSAKQSHIEQEIASSLRSSQ